MSSKSVLQHNLPFKKDNMIHSLSLCASMKCGVSKSSGKMHCPFFLKTYLYEIQSDRDLSLTTTAGRVRLNQEPRTAFVVLIKLANFVLKIFEN